MNHSARDELTAIGGYLILLAALGWPFAASWHAPAGLAAAGLLLLAPVWLTDPSDG